MNHCVPEFEIDEDYPSPPPLPNASSANAKKSAVAEEEIMELLWQNGQVVVVHAQNQRSVKKPTQYGGSDAAIPLPAAGDVRSAVEEIPPPPQQLFMQEDEMAAWLQCPLVEYPIDRYLGADLLYSTSAPPPPPPPPPQQDIRPSASHQIRHPPVPQSSSAAPRPPIPPGRRADAESASRFQNFENPHRPAIRPGRSGDSTVVESNETPMVGREYRVSRVADRAAQVPGGNVGCGMEAARMSAAGGKRTASCELTLTTSPCNSGASVSEEKSIAPAAEDRKRKGRDMEEDGHNAEADSASADGKKQSRASGSTKRSRAAEVHNLSERRRRDRINEKMKALQELIPRCNKSDKASMLDEAIEYLKSLQLQVQMMSMSHGCGMMPMMYPGFQQYMPAAAMSLGMGMGMNPPVSPFPTVLPTPPIPNASPATPLGPRFPIPPYTMPPHPFPMPDPSRMQASNQTPDPMLNPLVPQNNSSSNQTPFPIPSAEAFQHFLGLHHAQIASQTMVEPLAVNKPAGSDKDVDNPTAHQYG
ncbi:unnamed protein product [Cuscuta campestris]|uniref:BHLH domain-containing protein n=1 Tax=Cuscuta campestris TaxID=132261 RepID=A0A484NGF1_9ASTE|nr:unnamed protein product [Cuscuta campestris]